MKQKGVWLDFPENVPNDGELVLIHRKGRENYWDVAVYHGSYQYWEDPESDVIYYLDTVDKFMLIPEIE